MTRPARAWLDGGALVRNLAQVRHYAPDSRVMAVVKANGYGHGLAWTAQQLRGADSFAVTSIEEALELRNCGITDTPVCLLEGFFEANEVALAAHYRLDVVIHSSWQLAALENADLSGERLDVWLKLDTGMHRLGFPVRDARTLLARLKACRNVRSVRALSHFAQADDLLDPATSQQLRAFVEAVPAGIEGSIANSAGLLDWPQSRLEWVRPGLMLYGLSPVPGRPASAFGLQPVMTFTSAIIAIHTLPKGAAVGYGGTFICPEEMPVGVVAAGYGDGYPRHARSGTPVLVRGRPVPLAGRVSMDMITVDLRTQTDAQVGDPVVLWGRGLPAEEVAACATTIPYTLVCGVTPRIPRCVYDQ